MASPTTYLVVLTKQTIQSDFRANYFPRKFRYLSAAKLLLTELRRKGGDGKIVKTTTKGVN